MPRLRSYVTVLGSFFEYDTAKVVHIPSKKVGIINRLIQAAIVFYIALWVSFTSSPSSSSSSLLSGCNRRLHGLVSSVSYWSQQENHFIEIDVNRLVIGQQTWDEAEAILRLHHKTALNVHDLSSSSSVSCAISCSTSTPSSVLRQPDVVAAALRFTAVPIGGRTEDGNQMHTGGSVVGEASIIDP